MTPISPPMANDPVSPMNTSAGCALNHRNAKPPPSKAEQTTVNSPDPGIQLTDRYWAIFAWPEA